MGGKDIVQKAVKEPLDREEEDRKATEIPEEFSTAYAMVPWCIFGELGPEFKIGELHDYLDRKYPEEEDEWKRVKKICLALRRGYAEFRHDEQKLTKEVSEREAAIKAASPKSK